jgi:hypothetical protein
MTTREKNAPRNISNIKVSSETYIEIKCASIRKQVSLQEICEDILEKHFSKKIKQQEVTETNN